MAIDALRGEVWIVDLGYVGKRRPCLVLSIAPSDAERALAVIVPGTTSVRGTRFEVTLDLPFLRGGVFDVQNLQAVALGRFLAKRGVVTPEQMGTVEAAVRLWLGL